MTNKEIEQTDDEIPKLEDLIDMEVMKRVLHDFYQIVPLPSATINLDGEVLLESHWKNYSGVRPKNCCERAKPSIACWWKTRQT